jgi:hypothetical protein
LAYKAGGKPPAFIWKYFMKVIKPTTISPSSIVSTSVAETEDSWLTGTNYQTGDLVYDGYAGIYQALENNVDAQPSLSPTQWQYIRPSNRWAMFDQEISTVTSSPTEIDVTFATGNMQGIALLNVSAVSVTVTVTAGLNGEVIYTSTQNLVGVVYDWYQYFFFDPDTVKNSAIFVDLPPNYTNTYTRIVITGINIRVGAVVAGRVVTIGASEQGFTSGITDYSVKQTDEFGQTTFIRRNFSKRMSGRVLVGNGDLNRVQRVLYDLRAVPAVWFASENPNLEEALVVFGYYKDFSTDISYPNYSYCSLDIEGLI